MVAKRIALILLIVALGIGIFHAPIMRAVTGSFDMTVRVVDSVGNVLGGTAYAPVTLSRDCTITSAGAITCTKTNNVAFAASATTDTTVATNITTGTLATARI